ncbi:MAG: hypothetical protein JXB05_25455 [Myxococcaceae bacterium]|nr:hypothetical protein [Myxococcaceae bacterium]
MALDAKKRLVLVGALLGATVLWVRFANAQVDAPGTQQQPGTQPMPIDQAVPGTQPQPTFPQTPGGFGADAGIGGGGLTLPPPFGTPDAGMGGSGPVIPEPFLSRDGGTAF